MTINIFFVLLWFNYASYGYNIHDTHCQPHGKTLMISLQRLNKNGCIARAVNISFAQKMMYSLCLTRQGKVRPTGTVD